MTAARPSAAAGRRRSPRSASPTSARRRCCGSAPPAGRCTTRSSGRTGARRRSVRALARRRVSPKPVAAAHRPRDRPVFLRLEDPLAARQRPGPARARRGGRDRLRHDRQLSAVAADRRPAACDRCHQRLRARCCSISARLAWDDELARRLRHPARRSCRRCATPTAISARPRRSCSARPIPIAGVAGDQQAALIGQACFRPGMVKSTYGTGAFALLHTGAAPAASRHRLLTTIAYRLGGETAYALEGSIFIAGAAVQWLRDRLGAIARGGRDASASPSAPTRASGFISCPAFAGLGAPYWSPQARGALIGLTAECGLPEIARATLEAVGYQTRDLIAAMAADAGLADRHVCGSMAAWRRATGRCSSSPTSCRRGSSGRLRWRPRPGARPMSPGLPAASIPSPTR